MTIGWLIEQKIELPEAIEMLEEVESEIGMEIGMEMESKSELVSKDVRNEMT